MELKREEGEVLNTLKPILIVPEWNWNATEFVIKNPWNLWNQAESVLDKYEHLPDEWNIYHTYRVVNA